MRTSSRSAATLLVTALTGLLFLVTAPAALAASQNWYSASSPLTAWENDAKQALAYGTAYTKDGYLKNHSYYKDPRSGGDSVYTETTYSFKESTPYGEQWGSQTGKDQSARDNSGYWVDQYDKYDYSGRATASWGRVHVKVCEDQNNSPDPCSTKPYFTFAI